MPIFRPIGVYEQQLTSVTNQRKGPDSDDSINTPAFHLISIAKEKKKNTKGNTSRVPNQFMMTKMKTELPV